ncbi:MAG TPA: LemA family protein [Elusimicrobiota bacterium]|nr:LemA family protein [Elusimicrobiota bacterium]
MKKIAILFGIIAVFLLMPGCVGVLYYNRLVSLHEAVGAGWAQVENVLQRRYDLIPNLVNTVKGYAKHEKELFEEVTRLRSQWGEAKTPAEKVRASGGLEAALSRLLLVAERYPDLKANQNFLALQDELAGTENRIAVERMRYNEAVRNYNILTRRFPSNVVAGLTGFETSDNYFKAETEAKAAPPVQF